MREKLRKLKENGRRGFTLAELLIVIVITSIIAGFGFVEVSRIQKKLKRVEMDNIAREIFVAAQNHLTSSKTSGVWAVGYYDGDKATIDTSKDWQQSIATSRLDDSSILSTDKHAYYYVIYNDDNYADALTSQKSVLTQFLPFGSVDETVRTSGSYVIEFDAYTETIYGVFYTDTGKITKDNIDELIAVRNDETARQSYTLNSKTCAIGYYGGAVAIKNQVKELESPILHIYNDGIDQDGKNEFCSNPNILEVVIQDPNWTESNQTEVKVEVQQISPINNGKIAKFCITYNNGKFELDQRTDSEHKSEGINKDRVNSSITIRKDEAKGIVYHLSFDDITNRDGHFNDLFDTITPGADISVTATILSSSDATLAKVSDAKNCNSLYDSLIQVDEQYVETSNNTNNYEAVIRTGRHLANLSDKVSAYKSSNGFTLVAAQLKNSIDWTTYTKNYFTKDSKDLNIAPTKDDDNEYTPSNQYFLAITNPTLIYFNGNGQTLSNFNISTASGKACGLFGLIDKVSTFEVKNLTILNTNTSANASASSAALIGGAENNVTVTISNVGLGNSIVQTENGAASALIGSAYSINIKDVEIENSNLTSTGSGSAGGVIGVANGSLTIRDTHVYDSRSKEYENFIIQSNTSAGGLVGTITQSATIGDCSASVKVMGGSGDAGGLIGLITTDKDINIDNSYVGGKVEDQYSYDVSSANASNISGKTVGGFIGRSYAQNSSDSINIVNSYTTASVFGTTSNGYAGGFVGVIERKVLFTNVYSTGSVGATDNTVSVGSFAGYLKNDGMVNIKNNSYAGVLDQVSNMGGIRTIGSTSKSLGISVFKMEELKSKASSSTPAYPYSNLGGTYPYPSTSSNGHYGDWPSVLKEYNAGVLYYEKYDDGTYKLHGYDSDDDEVGDGNYSRLASTKVDDDGYVIAINDSYFENNGYHPWYDNYNEIFLCFNKYTYNWNWNTEYTSLYNLLYNYYYYDNVLQEIENSETIAKMGLSGMHVFKVNLDSDYIQKYYVNQSSTNDIYINIRKIGWGDDQNLSDYTLNPYYADSVTKSKDIIDNPTNYLSRKVRTASQLDRIIRNQGVGTFAYYVNNKQIVIHQELDIDMSSYYSEALKNINSQYYIRKMQNCIYQGDMVYESIETERLPELVGIGNTFIKYMYQSEIKDLTVKLKVGQLKYWQIDNATTDEASNNYGLFISNVQGNLTNVTFGSMGDDSVSVPVVSGLTVDSWNSTPYNSFGIIGNVTSGSELTKINFNNVTIESSSIEAKYIGLIGTSQALKNNLTVNGVLWDRCDTLEGTDFGAIIGYLDSGSTLSDTSITGVTVSNSTITATENTNGTNGNIGLIGTIGASNTKLTDTTVNTIVWDDCVLSGKNVGSVLGELGSSVVTSILTITNVEMKQMNVTATNYGVIGTTDSVIENLVMSDIYLHTDKDKPTTNYYISANSCGAIASITYNGGITGGKIAKDIEKGFDQGFTMENLGLAVRHWGVVGYNAGTIKNYDFDDISITDITSYALADNSNDISRYLSYGVVGENARILQNVGIQNVSLDNITIPDNADIGVIGLNYAGTIDNRDLSSAEVQIDNVSISTIYRLSNPNQPDSNCGFIGRSIGNSNIHDLVITNYTSGGYSFIYQVEAGTGEISRITMGSAEAPVIAQKLDDNKVYFVGINDRAITGVNVYLKNADGTATAQLMQSGSGSVSGTLNNGAPVTEPAP